MPLAECRNRPSPCRKLYLLLILLCQLAWIVPSLFFFLIQASTPRIVILQSSESQGPNATITSQGFAGPIYVFGAGELDSVNRIYHKWESFWPAMRERLLARGFVEPSGKTCFLWLEECYALAKHEGMLQIVTTVIGPKVLLYGMTVWRGRNEILQRFHRDLELARCPKSLNVVLGADVQFITHSHKIPERSLQLLLRNMEMSEEESLGISSPNERAAFLERSFETRVKKMVRTQDIRLVTLQGRQGEAVFLDGRTTYRVGEASGGKKALLLQFISGDCRLRDPRNLAWGSNGMDKSVLMPPALLVSGDRTSLEASNDVRLGLVRGEASKITASGGLLLDGREEGQGGDNIRSYRSDPLRSVTVFPRPNATAAPWREVGEWRSQEVGMLSTSVLAGGRIERFHLASEEERVEFRKAEGDRVVVVVRGEMLYFRASKGEDRAGAGAGAAGDGEGDGDGYGFCELLELKPGSAVRLSEKLLHALVPSGPGAALVSFRWAGYGEAAAAAAAAAEELAGYGDGGDDKKLLRPFTEATDGRTITLSSGQAYDPDNDENCDVVVIVVDGRLLQILPSKATAQAPDVLLIPAGESCVLWNVGGPSVQFFAMHLCRFNGTAQISTSFGASGKVF